MHLNCVICQDLLIPSSDVVFVTCGHMFHSVCLYQWIERSQSCPQCRKPATDQNVHKVYFSVATVPNETADVSTLQYQLDAAEFQIKLREKKVECYEDKNKKLKTTNKSLREFVRELETKDANTRSVISALKHQVKELSCQADMLRSLQIENEALVNKLDSMAIIQRIVSDANSEVTDMLKNYQDVKGLCTMVVTLKRELIQQGTRRDKLTKHLHIAEQKLRSYERRLTESEEKDLQLKSLETANLHLEAEKTSLQHKVRSLEKIVRNTEVASNDSVAQNDSDSVASDKIKKVFDLSKMNVSTNFEDSPSIPQKVQAIKESDSPYLLIKQSSVPLNPVSGVVNVPRSSQDRTTSIFKNPRLSKANQAMRALSDEALKGLGGHPNVDDFPPLHSRNASNPPKRLKVLSTTNKMRRLVRPDPRIRTFDSFFNVSFRD